MLVGERILLAAVAEFRGFVWDLRSRSSTLLSYQNASTPATHQFSKPFGITDVRTKSFPSCINDMILPRTNGLRLLIRVALRNSGQGANDSGVPPKVRRTG